jgi:hypothetical protein
MPSRAERYCAECYLKYSCGTKEEQARNQIIEGENLQAMVTLYRERGQVDHVDVARHGAPLEVRGAGKAGSNVVESAAILMEFVAAPHERWAELAKRMLDTEHR